MNSGKVGQKNFIRTTITKKTLLLYMLSICIPVYNTSITNLVHALYKQCTACEIPFEIVCIDDASSLFRKENATMLSYKEVHFSALAENVGRAVVRNLLAEQALFPTLLFLDSDISIPNPNFVRNYLDCLKNTTTVIVGGIAYDNKKSFTRTTKLHFAYGSKRESKSAFARAKNPYASFLTGNLLIQKKIVQEIQFLSTLKEYGHEDTLFCQELRKRAIPVLHIDNNAQHDGLENNEVFIQKQLTAVKNLSTLIKEGHELQDVSIYQFYLSLKRTPFLGLFIFCFGLINPFIKKLLLSGWTQWLLLFDLLRLYQLSIYLKKQK